jgi:hypothetical protein
MQIIMSHEETRNFTAWVQAIPRARGPVVGLKLFFDSAIS